MARQSEATLNAIKSGVDIVGLVGDYLPLQRAGSKFKALCPFHDDHDPSLVLDPERQSYKCWSCGAGGDIFDFVQEYERVEFPEALRMLAERAGVALETPESDPAVAVGPSKSDLLAVHAWAESEFVGALGRSPEALGYLAHRGLTLEIAGKFRIGHAPESKEWLQSRAKKAGFGLKILEAAGLVSRGQDGKGTPRDRFRGRLIFPIHDLRGRPIGFGGRVMPSGEKKMAEAGLGIAKYLNSPETALFQKRKQLYAVDLARDAARQAGWIAVVEGYTDVVAAHQAGLANVVGTLGTAMGDEHIGLLRRLTDRVVLVFDGDDAGQAAADRALPMFLAHEVDVRVLTLPGGQDPCDFLLERGREEFLELAGSAPDALDFAVDRALDRHDGEDLDGARRAAEEVLGTLARVPVGSLKVNNQLKVQLAVDRLAGRLRLPSRELMAALQKMRRASRPAANLGQNHVQLQQRSTTVREAGDAPAAETVEPEASRPIRPSELDPLDRELIEILLNEPSLIGEMITRVEVSSLRDTSLRVILQACFDLHGEGQPVSFDRVSSRLADPASRSLAAGLLLPMEPMPIAEKWRPLPWPDRLANLLPRLGERARRDRIRELEGVLAELDPSRDRDEYRALWREKMHLQTQRHGESHRGRSLPAKGAS